MLQTDRQTNSNVLSMPTINEHMIMHINDVHCTGLSTVEVSHYGRKSPKLIIYGVQHHDVQTPAGLTSTEVCELHGGTCVAAADCTTLNLYAKYRHSVLRCDDNNICCLTATNFYTLFGHVETVYVLHRRRRRRRRRYRKPWRWDK